MRYVKAGIKGSFIIRSEAIALHIYALVNCTGSFVLKRLWGKNSCINFELMFIFLFFAAYLENEFFININPDHLEQLLT